MKIILITLGLISLVLGLLGIVIPLLPTTPFVLLAAALFARSSPRLLERLNNSPLLGVYIRNYRENRAMPMRAKISSVVLMWLAILYCIFEVAQGQLWLQLTLLAISVAVSWHILSLGTVPRKPKD